jgi:phenylpropionate dioxygenase-like ring-hydroxylating dioxygenase large terminal subunit
VVESDRTLATFAINAVCTHLGCVVPFNQAEKKFICPCHGSQYNDQGRVVRGPAPLVSKLENLITWQTSLAAGFLTKKHNHHSCFLWFVSWACLDWTYIRLSTYIDTLFEEVYENNISWHVHKLFSSYFYMLSRTAYSLWKQARHYLIFYYKNSL